MVKYGKISKIIHLFEQLESLIATACANVLICIDPYALRVDELRSGAVDARTIQLCVSLNDNHEPDQIRLLVRHDPVTSSVIASSTRLCANATHLSYGRAYQFTAEVSKYGLVNASMDWHTICTGKHKFVSRLRKYVWACFIINNELSKALGNKT